ncbi:thioredoxin family protein [Ekhidna sp.]|uniref:thioredoxin family protein n=1 Tax=Ekhidna sp. TaxID=2608089 RepID=UPI003BAACB5F
MRTLKYLFVSLIVLGISSFDLPKTNEVKWLTFEEAMALHEKEPRKLIIDLYTDWCGWCKVMDKNTYTNPVIATYINENFYPIKFNAEQKEPVEFNGHTFEFLPDAGRKGTHSIAYAVTGNNLSGYPMTVFMDEELRIIQPISGYLKPNQMEPILKFIGGEHYKTTKWADFKKNHKSSL